LVVLSLSGFGVAVVYSATYSIEGGPYRNAHLSQMAWLSGGVLLMFVLSLTDYRKWVRWSWVFFLGSLVLLIVVLKVGKVVNGARSWLRFGPVSLEPAELAKVSFILFLAWMFQRTKNRGFLLALAILGLTAVPVALILKQPALGSASVFLPIAYVISLVGGIKKRYLVLPPLGALSAWAYAFYGVYQNGWTIPGLKPYQMMRIRTFFDPNLDPLGAGWTINQSLIAIGSGGFWGKGFLHGEQNIYGFLPKKIAYNDFIFSVVGEEWGFVGACAVVVAECIILLLCLRAAWVSEDLAGSLIAAGIFFGHMVVNIGMTIGLLPVTGIPLPFVSYGGTFLLVCLAAIGLVESVCVHGRPL
jgi:rod shape determining protein RodA